MPYELLIISKKNGSNLETLKFDSMTALSQAIQAKIDLSDEELKAPITLSEIAAFDVNSVSYSILKSSDTRLFYFERNAYEEACKRGGLRKGLGVVLLQNESLSNLVAQHGYRPGTKASEDPFNLIGTINVTIPQQIAKELVSQNHLCFVVIGDAQENIEDFKKKYPVKTNQPYSWFDIICAFFKRIFDKILSLFAGSDQNKGVDSKNNDNDDGDENFSSRLPNVPNGNGSSSKSPLQTDKSASTGFGEGRRRDGFPNPPQ